MEETSSKSVICLIEDEVESERDEIRDEETREDAETDEPDRDDEVIIVTCNRQEKPDLEKDDEVTRSYPLRKKPNYSKIREKVSQIITEIFGTDKQVANLEKHLYNAVVRLAKKKNIPLKTTAIEFQQLYTDIAYTFLATVTDKSPEVVKILIDNLKNDKVEWALFPEYIQKREIEESTGDREVEDGIYQCTARLPDGSICGSWKTKSCPMQTRSADEGFTIFIQCAICRSMWKQHN